LTIKIEATRDLRPPPSVMLAPGEYKGQLLLPVGLKTLDGLIKFYSPSILS